MPLFVVNDKMYIHKTESSLNLDCVNKNNMQRLTDKFVWPYFSNRQGSLESIYLCVGFSHIRLMVVDLPVLKFSRTYSKHDK